MLMTSAYIKLLLDPILDSSYFLSSKVVFPKTLSNSFICGSIDCPCVGDSTLSALCGVIIPSTEWYPGATESCCLCNHRLKLLISSSDLSIDTFVFHRLISSNQLVISCCVKLIFGGTTDLYNCGINFS